MLQLICGSVLRDKRRPQLGINAPLNVSSGIQGGGNQFFSMCLCDVTSDMTIGAGLTEPTSLKNTSELAVCQQSNPLID